jgi:hypothetical protein
MKNTKNLNPDSRSPGQRIGPESSRIRSRSVNHVIVIVIVGYIAELLKLCGASPGGAVGPPWGRELFLWQTFIFNEIWAQDNIYIYIYIYIYILVGTLLGLNILLTAYYWYWLRTISSTFCRGLKLEKYVIHCLNFMLHLFIWIYSGGGWREFHETLHG